MSLSEIWYYALPDGQAIGPMSKSALEKLAREGRIDRYTPVWDGGQFEWRPLHKATAQYSGGASRAEKAVAGGSPDAAPGTRSAASKSNSPTSDKAKRRAAVDQQRRDRQAQQKRSSKPAAFTPVGISEPLPPPPVVPRPAPAVQRPDKASAAAKNNAAAERVPLALRRWLARGIDIAVLGVLGAALLTLLAERFVRDLADGAWQALEQPWLLAFFALYALIPLEALALAIFGRTPGKALLGLRLQRTDGRGLGLFAALLRSWQVTVKGLLFGIPPLTLLAQGWGFVRVVNDNETAWDKAAGSQMQYAPLTTNGWLTALAVMLVSWMSLLSGETGGRLQDLLYQALESLNGF